MQETPGRWRTSDGVGVALCLKNWVSTADASVGLLLPCTVTVEWLAEARTGVRLTDPEALLSTVVLRGAPELSSVARDARERMVRVAESLAKS